ncbi:transcription factor IIIC, subunit 5 [Endogone sp. FLAS-F59071]|nr:transcription factor IIIC, subunit 5 [Endogone sp. FLAS-F59071]|eukprot:RUS17887.1 transcription factor IIIC, subunit 5 [Endogone sp. FLAS-F59071]
MQVSRCVHRRVVVTMADYQYIVDSNDPVPKLRRAMQRGDIKAITSFSLSTDDEDHSNLRNIPPPSFSRIEIPMNYGYRQNSAVVKVKIQRGDGQPPVIKLINRRKRKKFLVVSIDYETKDAPTGPSTDVSRYQQDISDTSLQRVKELFEKRPIWTRLALLNNLHPEDRPYIKKYDLW